jgi:hypothetical protein
VEIMVASAIFALILVAIFQVMVVAQKSMRSQAALDTVEGTATRFINQIGRDVRESSYPYVFAGDWMATKDGAGIVRIQVTRNYLSSSHQTGGATLVPGISNEAWGQCPNPACRWTAHPTAGGPEPNIPQAFLAAPTRNNPQVNIPTNPPPSFAFSPQDRKGRLFGHIAPGRQCPFCGSTVVIDAYFGGLLVFSPRRADKSFAYGGTSGYEVQWESLIFYCPIRDPNTGNTDIRRYQFFASALAGAGGNANLMDILDLDANGIIESPPMTDQAGNMVMDADVERFGLVPGAGAAWDLWYSRNNAATGRSFMIRVNRTTGMANVTVVGGGFATGGAVQIQTEVRRFGVGLSDFEVSTFINNPSWMVGPNVTNPLGVGETGVVRITLQVDRPSNPTRGAGMDREETVQTTTLRPRN